MPDWLLSDEATAGFLSGLRGAPRAAAAEAVRGAADQARAELPSLGVAARAEMAVAIRDAHVQLDGVVDAEAAHAIRLLAQHRPELQAELNQLAQGAGLAAADSGSDRLDARFQAFLGGAGPWVIGGLLAAALAAAWAASRNRPTPKAGLRAPAGAKTP